MLAGVNLVCFVACYVVALALEISRLFFRSGVRRLLILGVTGAGLLAHTFYLGMRAEESKASPLSNPHDWYLLAAWTLAALYLYLAMHKSRAAIGMFVLPLVLALIGAAQFADLEPFAPARSQRAWGNIHGSFLLLGTVTVMFGFIVGLMYLVQSYRLKHKLLPKPGFRLPSLEWLESSNSWALTVSVFLMFVGFSAGIILNWIKYKHVPWSDPVVLSSTLMIVWLLAAFIFNLAYRPARVGHKVAYLTLATFGFVVITLTVMLLTGPQHGGGL